MAEPWRTRLRTGLAAIAAVGLLVVAGRLWQPGSERLAPPGDEASALPQPLRGGVEFAQPISGLAVTPTAVWVALGTTIVRLDPHTLRATARLRVSAVVDAPAGTARPVRGLAAGDHAIWATLPSPTGGLLRIDPDTARVVAVVPVASVAPAAVSSTAVWVVCCGGETFLGAGQLVRVDPATNRVVARIALPGLADAVGVGPSGVWVRAAAGPVWRVDPVTNRVVATLEVPHGLGGAQGSVLVDPGAVWVSDPAAATVTRIDPRSNRIAARVDVAGRALAAAPDGTVLATNHQQVLGLFPGPVRSVDVDGLDGAYATALVAGADTIWVAESGVLFHVGQRELR